ncbi:MAG: sugar phosphate isomerase/epimerase family protein [Suipraeoptans sp.]
MKMGFVSSILDEDSFEDVIDTAKELGFGCVELACWPNGKAERRYAGVCHLDVENLDDEKVSYVKAYCKKSGVEISSLAYYPNTLEPNVERRDQIVDHLRAVIRASHKLDINMVTSFIGRDQNKTVEENLRIVEDVWPAILDMAKSLGVKIAIENCPMLFGSEQWPGGQNLMTSPDIWQRVFEILPYDNLGINFDPSHFVWQMMDYISPIYEFKDKIFHVHYKDIKLLDNKLKKCGIMAYPLDYMIPKIPGLGDVDWSKYISALTDIGYTGYSCIEIEDKAFEGSHDDKLGALKQSKRYLEQFFA